MGRHQEALRVDVARRGGEVVIAVAGELDIATVPLLESAMTDAAPAPEDRLVFDLAELSFMDASGLRVLLDAGPSLDGQLTLRAPTKQVERLLALTGSDRYFRVEHAAGSGHESGNLADVTRLWEAL